MDNELIADNNIKHLTEIATEIRQEVLHMVFYAKSGHLGSSLSTVEIVVALFFGVMRINPQDPNWSDRDRFVLSKGHACPTLYAVLAKRGYFDMQELGRLRQYHSILQGHPDMNKTPGVDMTSGSLGNGLSVGLGMALSARMKNQNYITYVMLGDGECQEGMVWEAAMAASHHHLKNIVAIVDCNGMQINGWVNDVLSIEPFHEKWKSFGWDVIEIDGHDMQDILTALRKTRTMQKPTVILAKTVKGKGISFMENDSAWHSAVPTYEQFNMADKELEEVKNGVR